MVVVGLSAREPPACARNFLRRKLEMLLESQQLPVVRIVRELKTGVAGERNHRLIGAQRIAEQARGAESCGTALQVSQQCPTDAMALPAVGDRKTKLKAVGVRVERVTGFANNGFGAVDRVTGPPRGASPA